MYIRPCVFIDNQPLGCLIFKAQYDALIGLSVLRLFLHFLDTIDD